MSAIKPEVMVCTLQVDLRDLLAGIAPSAEIEDIIGTSVSTISAFLGIEATEYNYHKHYLQAVVKARYQWADAMLAAREGKEDA